MPGTVLFHTYKAMHVSSTLMKIGQRLARVSNLVVKQKSDFQIRFASLQMHVLPFPLAFCQHYTSPKQRGIHINMYTHV